MWNIYSVCAFLWFLVSFSRQKSTPLYWLDGIGTSAGNPLPAAGREVILVMADIRSLDACAWAHGTSLAQISGDASWLGTSLSGPIGFKIALLPSFPKPVVLFRPTKACFNIPGGFRMCCNVPMPGGPKWALSPVALGSTQAWQDFFLTMGDLAVSEGRHV